MRRQLRDSRSARRSAGVVPLATLCACLCIGALSVGASEHAPIRILLIHPSDLMLPGAALQDRITREAIAAAVATPIDFYSEAFDMYRVPDLSQQQKFIDFLQHKYGLRPPQLIVAHGPMHELVKRHAAALWPGIPMMFVDVGAHRISEGAIPAGIPYTSTQMDVRGTVELALRLHPHTRRVLIVAGNASYDRDALARALRELKGLEQRVRIELLTDLSVREMMARLSALQADAIVLHLTVHTDVAGNAYVGRELAAELARVSAVPMYSFYDTYMGHGVVGGNLMNREGQRPAIGEIARRLIRGEAAADLPITATAPAICTVDWRQVQRWRIDESLIPQQCRVVFREASFWQRHSIWLIAGGLALLLQVAWLFAWRLQRQQRRRAEHTARQRTSELTHAARLGTMGGLMATITHEISQPLMSILTNAAAGERMIASGQHDMEEIRGILADIRCDDTRAGLLISHLREFMKKREVSMEPVRINEVVAKVQKIVESAARRHQVEVVAVIDANAPQVAGDAVHLQQVLLNLAMNGIEAMSTQEEQRRTLTFLTACTPQQGVEVAVSDTGGGIPPEQLTRLFEPFYSTKTDGMGIGLSIARSIVDAHGGRIWAESNEHGATMRFTIPPLREQRCGANRAIHRAPEPR